MLYFANDRRNILSEKITILLGVCSECLLSRGDKNPIDAHEDPTNRVVNLMGTIHFLHVPRFSRHFSIHGLIQSRTAVSWLILPVLKESSSYRDRFGKRSDQHPVATHVFGKEDQINVGESGSVEAKSLCTGFGMCYEELVYHKAIDSHGALLTVALVPRYGDDLLKDVYHAIVKPAFWAIGRRRSHGTDRQNGGYVSPGDLDLIVFGDDLGRAGLEKGGIQLSSHAFGKTLIKHVVECLLIPGDFSCFPFDVRLKA